MGGIKMREIKSYYMIVNIIDDIAKNQRKATEHDMELIKGISKEAGIYVDDFADANDCGKCCTWEEVVGAFRVLWANGERFQI